MKIILDEIKKEGVLIKNSGEEISRYSYKNILNDKFKFEDLKKDINSFNETLSLSDEFDDLKELSKFIKLHNF